MNVNARSHVEISGVSWSTLTPIGDINLKSLLEDLPDNCKLYLTADPVSMVVRVVHVQACSWKGIRRW